MSASYLETRRDLGTVLRERGAADFRKGITVCPFKSQKLKDGWQAGFTAQIKAEEDEIHV